MTSEQKSYLISQLSLLLDQMVDTLEEQKAVKKGPREMLNSNSFKCAGSFKYKHNDQYLLSCNQGSSGKNRRSNSGCA